MATETVDQAQLECVAIESGRDLKEIERGAESGSVDFGFCAICLEKIALQETALVKGCEHAYCVTCILRWASYKEQPLCPQCKHPFESLNVHRSLDGCIHDYMFEESVCLLLRATWFIPLTIEPHEEAQDETDDLYAYYYAEELEEEEDLESYYMRGTSSTIRIGNRRWGDSGYVRAGRKEARPIRQHLYIDDDCDVSPPRLYSSNSSSRKKDKEKMEGEGSSSKNLPGSSSSSSSISSRRKNKEKKEGEGPVSKELIGRRAKRAMKREAADRVAAAKHQQHLQRLGLVDVVNDRAVVSHE